MPAVKAKEDLEGHWWLTSERVQKGGKALRILYFQPFLISNDAYLEKVKAVVEV